MTEKQKELLKALHIIRKECKEHGTCVGCPLRGPTEKDSCKFHEDDNPYEWDLKPLDEKEEFWTPFQ